MILFDVHWFSEMSDDEIMKVIIGSIIGTPSSKRFEDQQLYIIYKYVTSSNVSFVANIIY